jgi:hypothetical protein
VPDHERLLWNQGGEKTKGGRMGREPRRGSKARPGRNKPVSLLSSLQLPSIRPSLDLDHYNSLQIHPLDVSEIKPNGKTVEKCFTLSALDLIS